MSTLLWIFYLLLGFFGIIYSILILYYTYGWYRLSSYSPTQDTVIHNRVSIIIPARNESHNIEYILEDLVHQTLSKEKFEVIIIDDHSTDNTVKLIKEFRAAHVSLDLKLINLSTDRKSTQFKKKAIQEAISKSNGDLIITTDADCRIGKRWVETILTFYEKEKPKMIVGPVSFHNEESIFEKMQTEEFLSLIAITGGAIRMNKPIMCNGANLAYEKNAFIEAGGFGSDNFSSGDDIFLMLHIRKIFGARSIRFIKSYNALVFTEAQKNFSGFLHQRIRWASKNKGYEINILFVSFTVYMLNLLIFTGLISSAFEPALFPVIVLTMLIKVLVDAPILIGIGIFAKRVGLLIYSIPLVVLYPIYIILVGAWGILGNYRWKGRIVKN